MYHAHRTRSTTSVPIIEKGLAATRPAAKANAIEVMLLFVEMEKPDGLIEDLVGALSHKQPKIIAATGATLTTIFHNYGCKVVDAKPVLKALPKMFGHADKNVRAEAQNLTVELYRWLREALKPLFWGELKPVQQQDLEKLFENVKQDSPPKQERFTRAQQEAMASASAQDDEGGFGADEGGEEDAGEVDVFDLAEPVDIFPKVPKDLHENLSSTKWKDRKEALDALFAAANVPRIKDGPFNEIIQALAKSMKDANISVVTVAANTIEALARGLRKDFAKHRSVIMPPIMERLKEKKQSVADALGQALDAVFGATSLSECLEDIFEYLKHKNPQVKQGTVGFLIRCLRTTRDVPGKPEAKSIAEAGTKLLTESSEAIRSGAAEILGTLMKILGERAMNPYLDGLDDIRKTKINEFFETAEVKAKERPKPVSAPPKAAAPVKKPAVRKIVKKPAISADPAPAPPEPAATQSPAKPKGMPSKLGVPKSGLAAPGAGLKRKLAGPGGAAPPQLASPQRRVVSPPTEDAPPPISQPRFGLGRGLAGRPIAKPSAPAPEPVSQPGPSVVPGMSAIERAELEELRLEKERLTRMTDEMRGERSKLVSEINELQNQNAQLIEDHTRDVLSIKAKETQLVRAKSDAETAEQTVQKQQREIERLKRELSRALRASTASPPNTMPDMGMNTGMGDVGVYPEDMSNFNGPPSSSSRGNLYGNPRFESSRPMSFASSNHSEERENNGGLSSPGFGSGAGYAGRRKLSPTMGAYSSGGGGSPARTRTSGYGYGRTEGAASLTSPTEPGENWKRAAEVTSQLKARIEQMKVGLVVRFTPFFLPNLPVCPTLTVLPRHDKDLVVNLVSESSGPEHGCMT